VSGPGQSRYSALVDAANAAAEEVRAKPVGKVSLDRRMRVVVDLSEVEGVQLVALAKHLGKSPSEIVVDALHEILVGVPRDAR
jgi:hypothetical protein